MTKETTSVKTWGGFNLTIQGKPESAMKELKFYNRELDH